MVTATRTTPDTVEMPPLKAGDGSEIITDAKGRKLRIREPDILTESRLVRSLGDAASNVAYMYGYVFPAAMVVEIDGQPMPFPMTEREIDAAIQQIGRHGLLAVMKHAEDKNKDKKQGAGSDELKK